MVSSEMFFLCSNGGDNQTREFDWLLDQLRCRLPIDECALALGALSRLAGAFRGSHGF